MWYMIFIYLNVIVRMVFFVACLLCPSVNNPVSGGSLKCFQNIANGKLKSFDVAGLLTGSCLGLLFYLHMPRAFLSFRNFCI